MRPTRRGSPAPGRARGPPVLVRLPGARLWNRVSDRDKRWASKTAECESGKDPKAIGGGGKYRGAFQFLKSTWRVSPHSPGGDPIAYNYKTQAVVAVGLMREQGRDYWPSCG